MRVVIAGGRHTTLTQDDYRQLDWLKDTLPITEVVSGHAQGVDHCGEVWARQYDIPVKPFKLNKERYLRFPKRQRPHIRNDDMAKYAQAVVLFPGGPGTDSMFQAGERRGLVIFDYRQGVPRNGNGTSDA